MATKKGSFRDDTIYRNRDRLCQRRQRDVERALDAWLKFDMLGTSEEKAAKTKFERARKAYVGAVKMRMRRREVLMRQWGLDG